MSFDIRRLYIDILKYKHLVTQCERKGNLIPIIITIKGHNIFDGVTYLKPEGPL